MYILIAISALILGLIIGVFFGKSLVPDKQPEINELKSALAEKDLSFEKLSDERRKNFEDALRQQQESAQREIEILKESHRNLIASIQKNHEDSVVALKEQFAESSVAMSRQLKLATEQMLKQRQEEFSESSGEKINNLLEPLKQSLKAMQEKVAENTNTHSELGGKLSESIRNLLSHTESAQDTTNRLLNMLKGNNRRQGEWGERILKEILETLNLQEGIHFHLQQTLTDASGRAATNEEGKMGRPDVILHLDENKDVIIDSKVSLSAYLQYQEAETEEARKDALRRHIASIEKHVLELVKKDYSSYVSPPRVRLGYVIMFVPNSSALHLATNAKPTLWREAMEKNVYIADEQTLYAALKIVSLTWKQIAQNVNHTKVFELADEMLQRVAKFMKHYEEIGIQLNRAHKSYEDARKKLDEKGHSIPSTCRKLIDLGAKVPSSPPLPLD